MVIGYFISHSAERSGCQPLNRRGTDLSQTFNETESSSTTSDDDRSFANGIKTRGRQFRRPGYLLLECICGVRTDVYLAICDAGFEGVNAGRSGSILYSSSYSTTRDVGNDSTRTNVTRGNMKASCNATRYPRCLQKTVPPTSVPRALDIQKHQIFTRREETKK